MSSTARVLVPGLFLVALGLASITFAPSRVAAAPSGSCPTGDCVAQRIDTQSRCVEETKGPQGNGAGWHEGLSASVDRRNYGGDVVAYQIQWSNGGWSGWYVKGVNDIDGKYNTGTNTLRRQWSYFADHPHKILVCR